MYQENLNLTFVIPKINEVQGLKWTGDIPFQYYHISKDSKLNDNLISKIMFTFMVDLHS